MGEIEALRDAFGGQVVIEVADQMPETARRLYPDVTFHEGLHSRHSSRHRWQKIALAQSIRWRRTRFAVRALARFPSLGRLLFSAAQREHLARIAASDAVVATGGTYFVEHYNFSGKADEVLAAQALGKPTWLYTQSMGPFTRPRSRSIMRRVVAGSRGVFLRDERSRGYVVEAGAEASRLSVHADAAFALVDPESLRHERPTQARARIAISVRSWSHARNDAGGGGDAESRYRHAVAEAARALARSGAEVVFVSTCQGVPEYWADDSRYASSLVRELLPDVPGVSVDNRFRPPAELARELRSYDVAIATRMHFAILALSVATPVVAIAYEFKSRELLRGMGMESLVADFEDVTGEWLVGRAREALARGAELREMIARQVTARRTDAIRPAHIIRAGV